MFDKYLEFPVVFYFEHHLIEKIYFMKFYINLMLEKMLLMNLYIVFNIDLINNQVLFIVYHKKMQKMYVRNYKEVVSMRMIGKNSIRKLNSYFRHQSRLLSCWSFQSRSYSSSWKMAQKSSSCDLCNNCFRLVVLIHIQLISSIR